VLYFYRDARRHGGSRCLQRRDGRADLPTTPAQTARRGGRGASHSVPLPACCLPYRLPPPSAAAPAACGDSWAGHTCRRNDQRRTAAACLPREDGVGAEHTFYQGMKGRDLLFCALRAGILRAACLPLPFLPQLTTLYSVGRDRTVSARSAPHGRNLAALHAAAALSTPPHCRAPHPTTPLPRQTPCTACAPLAPPPIPLATAAATTPLCTNLSLCTTLTLHGQHTFISWPY